MFTGDSVTDCGRRDDPDGLGAGYVREIAAALDGASVTNTGVSGNRVVDLRQRWRADVLDQAPELLSVLIGVNDMWRRYDSNDPTSVDAFDDGYRSLLGSVDTKSTRLVLVEPFLLPVTADQQSWREDLDPKIDAVRRIAADYGATLVPADVELNRIAETAGAAALAEDGVHPTMLGHRRLARIWLDAVTHVHG